MHTGIPLFYKVTFSRMAIDMKAVQRQNGLEQMMGGASELASVMGPNEDIASPIDRKDTVLICEDCSCKPVVLAEIAERVANQSEGENT
jgi:hypothetical protein